MMSNTAVEKKYCFRKKITSATFVKNKASLIWARPTPLPTVPAQSQCICTARPEWALWIDLHRIHSGHKHKTKKGTHKNSCYSGMPGGAARRISAESMPGSNFPQKISRFSANQTLFLCRKYFPLRKIPEKKNRGKSKYHKIIRNIYPTQKC